ncbi:hypothetical protein N5J77_05640 [Sphingobium yanoikuyae]|uniref:Uncharacterized protein n=1 Tax=Sphingobium yanoikuyae TaxID=13690 RepID=A0AA42WRR2_SPHYA|nr:hypothetical protein [Sphingobium yanoikuyae]MDH2130599.1 hypothetical protein [Sphingobium yanoikuyae]MDH2150307.1 hypothetical protein [Sphingobium yanoikuyae]MDH2166753.1 hypothetical protein [Sphingobium yanoikuyae]
MAKADRLERLDIRRAELEEEYRAALIAALRVTAAGRWGLFGHNSDRWTRENARSMVDQLEELAADIDRLREQLGLEGFDLHREFLAARGKPAADAVGEPKQAKAWLERLGADAN